MSIELLNGPFFLEDDENRIKFINLYPLTISWVVFQNNYASSPGKSYFFGQALESVFMISMLLKIPSQLAFLSDDFWFWIWPE